jgi:hypothetical protein
MMRCFGKRISLTALVGTVIRGAGPLTARENRDDSDRDREQQHADLMWRC